jgi:hypothetical protein
MMMPATDATLGGTSTLGYTLPNGQVFLQPGLSRAMQAHVLKHEGVHAFFSPQGTGALATMRQKIGQWGYDNSQLLRFTEEAIAEGVASKSVMQGLRHPVVNGYGITTGGMAAEGAAVGGGVIGAGYMGFKMGENR